jgi:hypothetical protein
MRCKQWGKGAWKFPASVAMWKKFAAQIMKQFKNGGFFSCSDRVFLRYEHSMRK